MIDESKQLGPISAVVGVGVLSFVVVLGALTWLNGPQSSLYFGQLFPATQPSAPQSKQSVLAALAAGRADSVSESEKIATLKSLSERIESGEEAIFTVEEKFEVLASLKAQQ